MRTTLICHHGDHLNRLALARWLASFSDLAGIVIVKENRGRERKRVQRELKRVGFLRFMDVLAYRIYHKFFVSEADRDYERRLLEDVSNVYPALRPDLPTLVTASPNSREAKAFLEQLRPDLMIARCKVILKPEVFEIPVLGTYVMHPGICPEYRNAHGCFWALAQGDLENVGMTLLKVDKGIDTGPVYGVFSYPYDERSESHIVIQHRTVFDNLDRIRDKFLEIEKGAARPIDTTGRKSGVWGQPQLTRYLAWKSAARKRAKNYETDITALS